MTTEHDQSRSMELASKLQKKSKSINLNITQCTPHLQKFEKLKRIRLESPKDNNYSKYFGVYSNLAEQC